METLSRDDRIRAMASPWGSGVEIAAYGKLGDGTMKVATIQWETIPQYEEIKPTLSFRMEQAQVLMDDLWNAGVRPTEGAGSAGAMRAAEHHIADLRRVAFKALGIE